jgi:hypothetical protein
MKDELLKYADAAAELASVLDWLGAVANAENPTSGDEALGHAHACRETAGLFERAAAAV